MSIKIRKSKRFTQILVKESEILSLLASKQKKFKISLECVRIELTTSSNLMLESIAKEARYQLR